MVGLVIGQGGADVYNVYRGRVEAGASLEADGGAVSPDFELALQRGFAWFSDGDGVREAGGSGAGLDARLVPAPVLPDVQLAAPAPPPEALPYVEPPPPTSIEGLFFQGYREGGGVYPEERIAAMIQCESSWHIDPGGYHLGLSQFDPGTWATVSAITGFADPYNPYHQGYNVAVWASMISPGTTAGWPSCFHAIDW